MTFCLPGDHPFPALPPSRGRARVGGEINGDEVPLPLRALKRQKLSSL